jgi:hypothetical protein
MSRERKGYETEVYSSSPWARALRAIGFVEIVLRSCLLNNSYETAKLSLCHSATVPQRHSANGNLGYALGDELAVGRTRYMGHREIVGTEGRRLRRWRFGL